MSRSIHFRRLTVRRMYGLDHDRLRLDTIAPGINVVFGPNASGKTTLARAIKRMLSPDADGGETDSVAADLVVGDQEYQFDYNFGQLTCRSEGGDAPLPSLAPAALGERYMLALHDLVQMAGDKDLVSRILREAAGGYDITAAAAELGFDRTAASRKNIASAEAFRSSQQKSVKAKQQEDDLQRQAAQLGELERDRQRARDAHRQQKLLEQAVTVLDNRDKLASAEQALHAFPSAMAQLSGDEWRQLEGIKKALATQSEKRQQYSRDAEDAGQQLASTGLPEDGISNELVETQQRRCDTLRSLSSEINRLETELAARRQESSAAAARLGSEFSPENATQLDSGKIDELLKLVRQAEELRFDTEADERFSDLLGANSDASASASGKTPSLASPAQLHEGTLLLGRWLAQQCEQENRSAPASPTTDNHKRDWLVAAGVTAVIGAGMTLFHLSWLGLLVLAAAFLVWGMRKPAVVPTVDAPPVEDIPRQWNALGLESPTAWEEQSVGQRLRELQHQHAAALVDQQRTQRLAELQPRREKLTEQMQALATQRDTWREDLGIDVDIDDARLLLVAQNVYQWQLADSKAQAAAASLGEARQQHDKLLSEIQADLAFLRDETAEHETPLTNAEQAAAHVNALEQRRQAHQAATEKLRQAERNAEEADTAISTLEREREKLFADLDLSIDDEPTLRQWTERFADYTEATRKLDFATRAAAESDATMTEHASLLAKSRVELEEELDSCRDAAKQLELLSNEIGGIETLIKQAKKETALEEALANEIRCREELAATRDAEERQFVGTAMKQFLLDHQRTEQQPAVLQRAGELFNQITHRRYQLDIGSGDNPQFLAIDTNDRKFTIDELSSGTKVHLLLAVRLAFVEQYEGGQKLPLLLDEALGNADERRAGNIIEAAIDIAAAGRQVFYFTAQVDELGKWRRKLEEHGVEPALHDLAQIREFNETEFAPDLVAPDPPRSQPLPAPDDDDWITYGSRLSIPTLDRRQHIGSVHLWYIMEDVTRLHSLLSNDINQWRQLQDLVQNDSGKTSAVTTEEFAKVEAAARLLDCLLKLWRQGRGKAVDRLVLKNSGAVTDSFIDRVTLLCETLSGDAEQLIEALRDGQVKRFTGKKIDDLEAFFTENGYLDPQQILSPEEMRQQAVTFAYADREAGLVSPEHFEYLLALVSADSIPESPAQAQSPVNKAAVSDTAINETAVDSDSQAEPAPLASEEKTPEEESLSGEQDLADEDPEADEQEDSLDPASGRLF